MILCVFCLIISLEDGRDVDQDSLAVKKSRMGKYFASFSPRIPIPHAHSYPSLLLKFVVLTFVNMCVGDFIDTFKTAAEGVKNHSSSVAAWMKNTVSPTLKTMLPASPSPPGGSQPSTSSASLGRRPVWCVFIWTVVIDNVFLGAYKQINMCLV